MDLINTPMSRVTCPNVENPENQAVQFWAFRVKMVGFCDLVGVGIAPVSKKLLLRQVVRSASGIRSLI